MLSYLSDLLDSPSPDADLAAIYKGKRQVAADYTSEAARQQKGAALDLGLLLWRLREAQRHGATKIPRSPKGKKKVLKDG